MDTRTLIAAFRVGERYGLPLILLLLLMFGCGYFGMWVMTDVIKPVTEKHIRFVESVDGAIHQIADSHEEAGRNLKSLHEIHQQQVRLLQGISTEQERFRRDYEDQGRRLIETLDRFSRLSPP